MWSSAGIIPTLTNLHSSFAVPARRAIGSRMPLFVLTCIDKPDALSARMAAREAHLAYVRGSGAGKLGGPFLDEQGEMAGSMLIIEAADLKVRLFEQDHGFMPSLGLRIGGFGYSTDVVSLDDDSFGGPRSTEYRVNESASSGCAEVPRVISRLPAFR